MAGHNRPPCAATTSKGLPCRARAVPGTAVCGYHGAQAPQVAAAAERRVALAEAERIAGRLGVIVNPADPHEAVTAALGQLRNMVQDYGAAVDELGPAGSRYEHDRSGEQIRGEVVIYQRALKDLTELSLAIVRIGLDARAAQLSEDQATEIIAMVMRAFDRAGLSEAQRQVASEHMRAEFAALGDRSRRLAIPSGQS